LCWPNKEQTTGTWAARIPDFVGVSSTSAQHQVRGAACFAAKIISSQSPGAPKEVQCDGHLVGQMKIRNEHKPISDLAVGCKSNCVHNFIEVNHYHNRVHHFFLIGSAESCAD
jgi:hypothetical protein